MPAWTDCAARRSHSDRSHRFDGPMRLRVPIRDDEWIGNIAADETLPPVILPSTVPFEMRGDAQSPATFTGHRSSIGASEHVGVTAGLLAHDA